MSDVPERPPKMVPMLSTSCPAKRLRPRARQPRLRLKVMLILLLENSVFIARYHANSFFLQIGVFFSKVVEGSQEEIQNLPGLPEPEPQVKSKAK